MRYHDLQKRRATSFPSYSNSLVFTFLLIILCGCEKPIKIVVVGDESLISKTIVFNEEDTLRLTDELDSIFLRPIEYHCVSIDGTPFQKFRFNSKGGLLNLSNREFVAFTLEYKQVNPKHPDYEFQLNLRNCIVIDSNLVCNTSTNFATLTENSIRLILDSIAVQKYGNYRPEAAAYSEDKKISRMYNLTNYDTSPGVAVFKKFGKDKVFIEKFWDFGLDEEIPKTIVVKTPGEQPFFNVNRTKICIVTEEAFLILASLKPEEYDVIDVREYLRSNK